MACELFIKALSETRERCKFKLIGYVLMPDHVHLILNPLNRDISVVMRRLKSTSARHILDWLRESNQVASLRRLALAAPQSRSHTHSLWLKDFSSIDLWTTRFVRQKLNYIHLNPVRAGLCKHPAEWRWSSYRPIFHMHQAVCQSRSISVAIGKTSKSLLKHRRATPASKQSR